MKSEKELLKKKSYLNRTGKNKKAFAKYLFIEKCMYFYQNIPKIYQAKVEYASLLSTVYRTIVFSTFARHSRCFVRQAIKIIIETLIAPYVNYNK